MVIDRIMKKLSALAKMRKYRNMPGLHWTSNACWNVETEFDYDSRVDIADTVAFRNGCVIRVRGRANLSIGAKTTFNNGCIITCREAITIGERVLFGPNVMVFDNDHDYRNSDRHNKFITGKIVIEDDVWIGANVTILRGTVIKQGAVIGANSVVKGVIEKECVYIPVSEYKMIRFSKSDTIKK